LPATSGTHRLAEARRKKKLNQRQLAERSGIHRTTLYRIEKGELPRVNNAISLARAVGKTVEWLWGDRRAGPSG
jgi:DNA-binding XRE family transcriptional regulator